MNLHTMLKTPGFFQVALAGMPHFFRVEVDEKLRCHQLTPDLQRDGILSPDRWATAGDLEIVRLDVSLEHMAANAGRYRLVQDGSLFYGEIVVTTGFSIAPQTIEVALAESMVKYGYTIVYLP